MSEGPYVLYGVEGWGSALSAMTLQYLGEYLHSHRVCNPLQLERRKTGNFRCEALGRCEAPPISAIVAPSSTYSSLFECLASPDASNIWSASVQAAKARAR